MRWLGKSQSGKYPYEGSICHKSKCYHWSLGRSSLGTNRSEILGAEFWQAKCGFCGPESMLLSWVWAIHTLPPNLGLAYKTLENPSLEEDEGFFSCTEDLIFMERVQLLSMRSTGALSPEDKSHVPHQPPCASSHCPPCSAPAKPTHPQAPQSPSEGEPELSASWAAVHLLCGQMPWKRQAVTHTFREPFWKSITHPLKARALVGVLHSLC